MDGQPVWLASISLRDEAHRIRAVPRWSKFERMDAEDRLRELLEPVGDTTRERLFRMNVTLCLHKAATDEEARRQPVWFRTHPAVALAGGPVEVLWENVTGALSTKPCRRPKKVPLDPVDRLLWLPRDCGECPPCRARAAIQ
jgi:hypothetical protein